MLFGLVGIAAAGIQVISGESWLPFYVLFPIASIAITLWIIYLGIQWIIYLGIQMWWMAATAAD